MSVARGPLLALLLACTGCAVLQPPPKPTAAVQAAIDTAAVPWLQLVIEAPTDLRRLLEANLDLARLRTLAGNEAVSDTELARLVGAAPAQARELLQTEGYFSPVVEVRREPGPPPLVRVTVAPGPRARIGRFDFDVEGELERSASAGDVFAQGTLQVLRNTWLLKPGMPFRNPLWSDAKGAALAQLRAEGYASASWSGTSAQVDAQTDLVRLYVVADSGPRFHAGPLDIRGLEHHDEITVRNLAGFSRGDALTDRLLLDFQERLQTSGLFDRASVVLEPDPALAADAPITVRLHETARQQATFGVGYSANTGPRASVEYWDRRLFGLPLIARNKLEVGRDRNALDGEVTTHPKHDFYRDLIGYAIEQLSTSDTETVNSARVRIGRSQDMPKVQRLYFVELQNATRHAPGVNEQASSLTANYNWLWRELDSPVLPTRGFSLSLQSAIGGARDNQGRSGPFSRLYGRVTNYWPLAGNWFAQSRLELGQVLTTRQVEIPDPLRFRAGGDDSVRGYGYRTLAPTDGSGALVGGKSLFTTSVELGHPISPKLPAIWWAVFADAGRAAQRFGDLKPAYGVGAGLRWRSPVGPLKVDLAHGNEAQGVRLHLSVGITF
jgi:translocation and assembly module TamA